MKLILASILVFLVGISLRASSPEDELRAVMKASDAQGPYDKTAQFIFHSVLEGLYDDGLSNADVDRILMKKPDSQYYLHFIYACPVCTPTIWALEAYRNRPTAFYSMKMGGAGTFGPGLSEALHRQLYSNDLNQQLAAINAMMQNWMARHMNELRLTSNERADLLKKLEEKRQQGMHDLDSFRHPFPGQKPSVDFYAPAYVDIDECAVCNGAVGKPMKLPGDAPGH